MQRFVHAFALWLLLAGAAALAHPPLFAWFAERKLIDPGLMIIMLTMGLTLSAEDFLRIARDPKAAVLGIVLQYVVMPAVGFGVSTLAHLSPPYAAGMILVFCCPGGTASNVISYLAKADVPLSVSMTSVSTLIAVVMTPMLSTWLIGNRVEVSASELVLTTIQIVIGPVVLGLALKRWLPRFTERIVPFAPAAAVATIVLIVASVLAVQRDRLIAAGPGLVATVFAGHLLGFAFGFALAVPFVGAGRAARTIAIEVGMQNSGLGVSLARNSFADPLVALPCAISAIAHSLIGAVLAAIWGRRPTEK